MFSISLKFLQQNMLETPFAAKLIVFTTHPPQKNIIFPKNIYVIIMSECTFTPECTNLHDLKKKGFGGTCPNPLAMYCNTSHSLKNYTPMIEYGFIPLLLGNACNSLDLCQRLHHCIKTLYPCWTNFNINVIVFVFNLLFLSSVN